MRRRSTAALALAIASVAGVPAAAPAPRRGAIERVEHRPLLDAPSRGRPDAPVTVEVFFSPAGKAGAGAYQVALALWRKHPARVRLVFRPLLRSDGSQYLAPLALAAHARGQFFEFMADVAARGATADDAAFEAAGRVGIDPAIARTAVTDPTIVAALDANNRLALRARTSQRADLVVNGRPMSPGLELAALEVEYQRAFARAKLELASGAAHAALPTLAARRRRCASPRPRTFEWADSRSIRLLEDEPEVATDDPEAYLPTVGWHLGTLLRHGTACAGGPPPPGRIDRPFGYDPSAAQPGPPALLAAPLDPRGLPSRGPADAPVLIDVVCDLRSPLCTEQLLRANRMVDGYWPSVRAVYRPWVELSDENLLEELALPAAVLCGQRLGDGWAMVMALLGAVPADGRFEPAAIRAAIDPEAFAACTRSPPEAARRLIEAARAAGVAWSPTLVVGRRAYVGGVTDDRLLADLLDLELAPGLLDADSPIPAPTHRDR